MRSEDRLSVIGIVIGVAWGAASAALPLAFPSAPAWVWQLLFWAGATVLAASAIYLAYELSIRPRDPAGKKMDPLLWISATALSIGILALGGYIAKGPAVVAKSADGKRGAPAPAETRSGPDRTQLSAQRERTA